MADCCEEDRSTTVRNKSAKPKITSSKASSSQFSSIHKKSSISTTQEVIIDPIAPKRRKLDKFSLPPVPGTRTGLRSQSRSASTSPRWTEDPHTSVPSMSKASSQAGAVRSNASARSGGKTAHDQTKKGSDSNVSGTDTFSSIAVSKSAKSFTDSNLSKPSGAAKRKAAKSLKRDPVTENQASDTPTSDHLVQNNSLNPSTKTSARASKYPPRETRKRGLLDKNFNTNDDNRSDSTQATTTGEAASKVRRGGAAGSANADGAETSGMPTSSSLDTALNALAETDPAASSRGRQRSGTRPASQFDSRASLPPLPPPPSVHPPNPPANEELLEGAGANAGSDAGGMAAQVQGLMAMFRGGPMGATGSSNSQAANLMSLQAFLQDHESGGTNAARLVEALRHQHHQRSFMVADNMKEVQTLIPNLQSSDRSVNFKALTKLCELLVMGNEETLSGFPIDRVVPDLIKLLELTNQFEISDQACRALTYMLDALPRSSKYVVNAVPAILAKLNEIECMDVAEQGLSTLKSLSTGPSNHSRTLLAKDAIKACLTYIDFFSMEAQRSALQVTANCCQQMSRDDWGKVRDNLPILTRLILNHSDKKCVESVCSTFSNLVRNYQQDERILKEIAAHEMLSNVLKLLIVTPSLLQSHTFTMIISMLVTMCTHCSELAVCMLRLDVTETLVYLLCGTHDVTNEAGIPRELVPRCPQQMTELVSLICELMPPLPHSGVFSIDLTLNQMNQSDQGAIWQWQDDKGGWRSYEPSDSLVMEEAYAAQEEEIDINIGPRLYKIDFATMQQINESTDHTRRIQRVTTRHNNSKIKNKSQSAMIKPDARAEVLAEQPELTNHFIKCLFSILYDVYSSSAGPNIKHKCLQALLRQIYYSSPELLNEILQDQPVSSHLASMLGSHDVKVVVASLQMSDILIRKLPTVFGTFFYKQGVTHQIKELADKGSGFNNVPAALSPSKLGEGTSGTVSAGTTPAASSPNKDDVDTRSKKLSKRTTRSKAKAISGSTSGASSSAPATPSDPDGAGTSYAPSSRRHAFNRRGSAGTSNPNRQMSAPSSRSNRRSTGMLATVTNLFSRSQSQASNDSRSAPREPLAAKIKESKEKVRTWIRNQANQMMAEHFVNQTKESSAITDMCRAVAALNTGNDANSTLSRLTDRGALKLLSSTLSEDVSPFEIIHSGVTEALLEYLTLSPESTQKWPRETRMRHFLDVFLSVPDNPTALSTFVPLDDCPLRKLIKSVMQCLHQQEQFQVKVHDLGLGGSSNGNPMRFFNSRQFTCNLVPYTGAARQVRACVNTPVKVDPLAQIQQIERYLVMKGCSLPPHEASSQRDPVGSTPGSASGSGQGSSGGSRRLSGGADADSSGEGLDFYDGDEIYSSDEDDDGLNDGAAVAIAAYTSGSQRLEIMLQDNVLPYDMTVFQAVKNYSPIDMDEESEGDHGLGHSALWTHVHTFEYRLADPSSKQTSISSRPGPSTTTKAGVTTKSKSKSSKRSRDQTDAGLPGIHSGPLEIMLSRRVPDRVSINDTSSSTLALIRALHTINRFWGTVYGITSFKPIVPPSDFVSAKLTAKANRQIQDPIVIMTGNMPAWLPQVARACPFLFPFETRQMLFYVCQFDKDRALMKLQGQGTELLDTDHSRVNQPRVEKRKLRFSRENLLQQAESKFSDNSKTRALIEVSFEDEAGTGLGPTLEFYALVSKELLSVNLGIWYGSQKHKDSDGREYVDVGRGLYPKPLAKSTRTTNLNKVKAKFRFIGRLLAKSLMDSRIVDLPLNTITYAWLLGQQSLLTDVDIQSFDDTIANSYNQLKSMSAKYKTLHNNPKATSEQIEEASEEISDLGLDFTWPGLPHIQLKRNGKDELVTAENIDEYLSLLSHWILSEGIGRQMEAMREGFDQVFQSETNLSQLFHPTELEQLFCGNSAQSWQIKELMECCRADHGYTLDSPSLLQLFTIMSEYGPDEQRLFLSFVTGSPRLPVGGFRSLNPPLTIVRKDADSSSYVQDQLLPSVMTCVNYLKLPMYSSVDIMKSKLDTAINLGQLSFSLS